jgi:type I protein arginine methyltransferase
VSLIEWFFWVEESSLSVELDFYGRIKLVNYIRSEVAKGNIHPDTSSNSLFSDDKYLQPVIKDDALLFSLDELDNDQEVLDQTSATPAEDRATVPSSSGVSSSRITELEDQLAKVTTQFAEYRTFVQDIIDKRWQDSDKSLDKDAPANSQNDAATDRETNYFDSYSYNGIHTP